MSKISRSQQTVLDDVFSRSHAGQDVRNQVTDDLRQHGRIRDSYEAWRGLLSQCDATLANNARVEIPVEDKAHAVSNSARRFSSDAGDAAQSVQRPVASKEPSARIDEQVVDAWLRAIGVDDHEQVKGLSIEQRDTLARVAARNRRIAQRMVFHQPLAMISPLPRILDQLRPLMLNGVHSWERLFNDEGLFNEKTSNIWGALAVLNYASSTVSQAARFGLPMQIRMTQGDVQWELLPEAVRNDVRKRLEPYLGSSRMGFDQLSRRTIADVVLQGDLVVDVIYVGMDRTAFATPQLVESPVRYANNQIHGYQLLAMAKEMKARGVEIMLYGNNSVDRGWAKRMIKAAREMGLGFVIRHTFHQETEWVDGQIEARAITDRKPIRYTVPALRPPKTQKKKPAEAAAEATPAPAAPAGMGFVDMLSSAASIDGELTDWAGRVHRARQSAYTPKSVRMALEDVMQSNGKTVGAEEGLERLHREISDEVVELFRSLDELDGQADTIEEQLADMPKPETLREIATAQEDVRDLIDRFGDIKAAAAHLMDAWDSLDRMVFLVHPQSREAVFAGTAKSIVDEFGNTYVPLEGRLNELKSKLEAREAGLALLHHDKEIEILATEAQALIDDANAQIDKFVHALNAAKETARSLFDLFDSIDTHTPEGRERFFKELSGHDGGLAIGVSAPGSALASRIGALANHLQQKIEVLSADDPNRQALEGKKSSLLETKIEAERVAREGELFLKHRTQKLKETHSRAAQLENQIEIPAEIGLQSPLERRYLFERRIEGKGNLRFKKISYRTRINVGMHGVVQERFSEPRVLVAGSKAFLVSRKAAKEIAEWRRDRSRSLSGIDLLGRGYELAAESWGIRLGQVDALPAGHDLVRIVGLFDELRSSGGNHRPDFIYTIAHHAHMPGVGEIFEKVISSLINKINFDETQTDKRVAATMAMIGLDRVVAIASTALASYELIEGNDTLAENVQRWYQWGDGEVGDIDKFEPIKAEDVQRLNDMSMDDVSSTMHAIGLLPSDPLEQKAWVDEWKSMTRIHLAQRKKRARRDSDKAAIDRQLKRLQTLPEPYMLIRALAERLGQDPLMSRRFDRLEERYRSDLLSNKERWDDLARCRFALKFLYEHQYAINKRIFAHSPEFVIDEPLDSYSCSAEELYDYIAGSVGLSGFSGEGLVALGRAYLERYTPAYIPILPDAAHLIMGRLLMFGDDNMVSDFVNEINFICPMCTRESKLQEAETELDPSYSFEQYLRTDLYQYWNECEPMLELTPLSTGHCSRFIAEYETGKKSGKGGSGQNGSTPAASGGIVTSGAPFSPPNGVGAVPANSRALGNDLSPEATAEQFAFMALQMNEGISISDEGAANRASYDAADSANLFALGGIQALTRPV